MPSYMDYALAEAQRQGVDPALVQSIMQAETGGQADPGSAVSGAGAIGPMQLMPATAKMLGVDPNDPLDNIRGGVSYLGRLSQRFGGDPRLVAAAYNAGPTAVSRALAQTGDIPNYPETRAYVDKVTAAMGDNKINPDWLEPVDGKAASAPVTLTGPQPVKINPDWLEGASPSGPSPTPAPKGAPAAIDNPLDRFARWTATALVTPPKGMEGLIAPYRNEAGGTIAPGQWSLGPVAGHLLRGIAMPIDLADKYIATPLTRLIPEAIGGNPNEQPFNFGQRIAEHTRAPESTAENLASKAAGYAGGAVGMGRVLGAAAPLARVAGLPKIAGALESAGAITPGNIGGAVTGGAAAEMADKFIGQHVNSPIARTAIDMGAGVLGGWPGAALGNRLANGVAADTAATLAAAKASNVPVQMSDVSPAWQSAMRIADKVPFGNVVARNVPEQQVAAVRQALASAAEKYRPAGLDDTAGTSGTDRFIANDLRSRYESAKQVANAAYDKVQQVMAQYPDLPPIELSATKQAVKDILDDYPEALRSIQLSNTNRRILGTLSEATTPPKQTVNIGGKEIDLSSNPTMRAALEKVGALPKEPQLSLADARRLSSNLWTEISRVQGTGAMSAEQVGLLKKLAGAVGADVDSYMAKAPADVRSAYAQADELFKSQVLPFRADPKVYKLVSSRTPTSEYDLASQGIYNNLFNTAQGERSKMALELMSPAGRQAATYQALKDAADKGLSTASPNGLKVAAANRALDIEGNPALANIAQYSPEFAADADRLARVLQIGRQAVTSVAGKGALTGFQTRHVGPAAAMYAAAAKLAEHYGPAIGYSLGLGAPVGAANIVSLLNRIGPQKLPLLLANPGTVGQRAMPGAVQGLLAAPDEQQR